MGIVAEVCREIEVADWLDQQEPSHRQYVSVGTARVAMALNGLGFSNRRLYLTPQFYADKPVEHLLDQGSRQKNSTTIVLDRRYERDVTRLFAGLALQAWRAFGTRWVRLYANHQQQKYALACRHVLEENEESRRQ